MHRIIYLSTANTNLNKDEINNLLNKSNQYNVKHKITGILLYIDFDFIQVLEGSKEDVHFLFEKIKRDNRHRGIICVIDESIKKRQFSAWSMGFYSDSYQNLKDLKGFENINRALLRENKDEAVAIFLNTFLQSHRKDIIQF